MVKRRENNALREAAARRACAAYRRHMARVGRHCEGAREGDAGNCGAGRRRASATADVVNIGGVKCGGNLAMTIKCIDILAQTTMACSCNNNPGEE